MDMVGNDAFSNRVLHFGASLRGTRQFWFKQKSRRVAMVDTLGLPTVFFTHSAADLQWPELARLLGVEDPNTSTTRSKRIHVWLIGSSISESSNSWMYSTRVSSKRLLALVGIPAQRQSPCTRSGLAPNVEKALATGDSSNQ